jgi:GNAT superfamily N-acetyltransferase
VVSLTLRVARTQEREALEALQRRASLANPGDREALLAHPEAIAIPEDQIARGDVIVAQDGEAIAGFAALQARDDGDVELDGLFVDPAHWRRGIARQLVDRCCDVARERGAKALHVIGNPHATGFYDACGFVELGRKQTRFGTGLVMCKYLAP